MGGGAGSKDAPEGHELAVDGHVPLGVAGQPKVAQLGRPVRKDDHVRRLDVLRGGGGGGPEGGDHTGRRWGIGSVPRRPKPPSWAARGSTDDTDKGPTTEGPTRISHRDGRAGAARATRGEPGRMQRAPGRAGPGGRCGGRGGGPRR